MNKKWLLISVLIGFIFTLLTLLYPYGRNFYSTTFGLYAEPWIESYCPNIRGFPLQFTGCVYGGDIVVYEPSTVFFFIDWIFWFVISCLIILLINKIKENWVKYLKNRRAL